MEKYFDHEKLIVYQKAIEFNEWVSALLEGKKFRAAVRDQLDRASTSIALNIAEGNGKTSVNDRCRFFEISRGSSLECAACLDILLVKKIITTDEMQKGKMTLKSIVSMLTKLNQSLQNRDNSKTW